MIKHLALACVATFSLFASSYSIAQPSGAEGDDFIYNVRAGDTLSQLAKLYTGQSNHWRTLQSLNNVADPFALPIGKALRIPFALIAEVPGQARISHFSGDITINGQRPQTGTMLNEGDEVIVGSNAFLTLLLSDDSTITLPPSSKLSLKRLRDFAHTALTDSILQLESGELETRVAPDHRGVGRFEVHTPVSVTGVRGTDLRVRNHNDSSITEVISGRAKLQTEATQAMYIKPDQGSIVNASGAVSTGTLLPAPDMSAPERGPNGWQVTFPPLAGAEQYLVQVTLDEEGSQLYSRTSTPDTTVSFHSGGPGTHYVRVRGIAADGLMGRDAVASFPGQRVLLSSDGTPVMSSFDLPIGLQD